MWYYCTRYFTNVQPVCAALSLEKRERFSRIPSDFAPPPRRRVHRAPCRRVHRAPRRDGSCGKIPVGCICFSDGSSAPTPDPIPCMTVPGGSCRKEPSPGSSACKPVSAGVAGKRHPPVHPLAGRFGRGCEEERHTHPRPNPMYAGFGGSCVEIRPRIPVFTCARAQENGMI